MGAVVLSEGFPRVNGVLHCEGVPLPAIAAAVGTPTYVYAAGTIRAQLERLRAALGDVPHRIHYAVKANGSLGILRLLREAGAGADVVSHGELHRALAAGWTGADIVFDGPGKSDAELRAAVAARVACLNVESAEELRRVAAIAAEAGVVQPVGLRINPEVAVENFHEYISTGEAGDKFGIPHPEAFDAGVLARSLPSVRLVGLHMHVGSMLSGLAAFEAAVGKLADLIDRLRALDPSRAAELAWLDLGGGLPIRYDHDDEVTDLREYAAVVARAHARSGCTIVLEPGRLLVGASGALLSRVLYRKASGGRQYVIVDAAMNDLIRPSLYEAYHRIEGVAPSAGTITADVAGPVCESGDFFAKDRVVDDVAPGGLVVLHTAGAYGMAMASNYNARPRGAEVLVDGARFAVIRERERVEDLIRLETAEPRWRDA